MTHSLPIPKLTITHNAVRDEVAGDIYFSVEGGVQETRHVFLAGNGLPNRFASAEHFTIAETGFGTGLNFLCAWNSFAQHAPAHAILHYFSVEHAPLSLAQLQQVHVLFPELDRCAEALRQVYPLRIAGWHHIPFGQVHLWLGLGDAAPLFSELHATVDAWFLDGFAPAKNPSLWQENLFAHMARLSHAGTTLATFTAAAAVRDGLGAHGFAVEKIRGFGKKRDMLRGQFTGGEQRKNFSPPEEVLVVGAGIAGASTAHGLAERGVRVRVIDAQAPASGASGNPAAVLFPRLGKAPSQAITQSWLAYAHMLRLLPRFSGVHASPGMLKLPKSAEEEMLLRAVNTTLGLHEHVVQWIEPEEVRTRSGLGQISSGGLWFPEGTWLQPRALIVALLDHPNITVQSANVHNVEPGIAHTNQGKFCASHIVLAQAGGAKHWPLLAHYKLHEVAGQVSLLSPETALHTPDILLCHKGYAVPLPAGLLIGATYDHEDLSCSVREDAHEKNIADAQCFLPGLLRADARAISGRASLRCNRPGRVPLVGEIAPGIYANLAHGSRGMLSAPFAADRLVTQMMDGVMFV